MKNFKYSRVTAVTTLSQTTDLLGVPGVEGISSYEIADRGHDVVPDAR